MALKPIYDAAGIERVNVATYQAVSGKGKKAIEELEQQTIALFNSKPALPTEHPRQIAFNVLPQIDAFQENGYTREEMKMVWETQKILGDDTIRGEPHLCPCAGLLRSFRGSAHRDEREDQR